MQSSEIATAGPGGRERSETSTGAEETPLEPPGEPRAIRALVEARVERAPEAVAAEFEQERLTYRELNERANRLAHLLRRRGIGPEQVVGISLERSLEMVVALLAVRKAGGGYIWLDPAYPKVRLAFMVEDAQPRLVVTRSTLLESLPPLPEGAPLCLDLAGAELAAESAENPPVGARLDDLVYVIYTSGSTGQPKGVAMGRRALSSLIEWQLGSWTLPAAARTLQFTSLNFDVSFQEIFTTLCAGGTLVLTSEAQRRDPAALLRLIRDRRVERIFLPFVALQQLAKAFEAEAVSSLPLRDVITAGEQLQITPQIRALFESLEGCPLHNQYGPAESHIIVTSYTLRGAPAEWPLLPPIGRPIAQARIYLLDEQGQPVADGAPGEIHIGGAALARGYLKRAELTAARFIPDPFSDDPEARLYRTGDLGQLLPDGNIQYLGRSDQQVKVRGVRVEMGEVEALLAQHPAVLHAVVAVREVSVGDKRLIAYVVPKPGAASSRDDLRHFLQAKLPPQSVPSAFVFIESIPLTPSGKADRLALPDPDPVTQREGAELIPAETDLQREIVAIWQQNLNAGPIGLRDNFFDLGGDSLIAAQIANDLEQQCRKIVPIAWTFSAPTVEELIAQLQDTPHAPDADSIIGLNTAGTRRPFFCICGFFDIARHLGADQPFYKIDLKRLDRITDPTTAFQTMAEECLREIRAVQPEGPFSIGGHSLGGVVAFEVARRLRAEGHTVSLLALLEPDLLKPTRLGAAKRSSGLALSYLRRLSKLSLPEQWAAITASWRSRLAKHRAKQRVARDFATSSREDKGLSLEGNYVAERYPGRITLFLAADFHTTSQPGLDPRRDWARLARGGAEVHVIPGDHETMLREPNVRLLAGHLRGYLEAL